MGRLDRPYAAAQNGRALLPDAGQRDARLGGVTQFIGNIRCPKPKPHRHCTKSALIFKWRMGVWTERTKTPVLAGDVLFLPRKQRHSVQ